MWTDSSREVTCLWLEKFNMAQLAGVRLVTYLEYLSARRTSPVERNVTVDVQTASREMLLIIHPYIHYRTAGTLIH